MNVILIAVISLGVIALVSAAILYVASKKFAVYEDPRIAQVAGKLTYEKTNLLAFIAVGSGCECMWR